MRLQMLLQILQKNIVKHYKIISPMNFRKFKEYFRNYTYIENFARFGQGWF